MNEGLIPHRYAKALYKYASEKGCDERMYRLMDALASGFAGEPGLQSVMSNPFVSAADKVRLLFTAAGASDDDACFNDFMKLLTENSRLPMVRDIALAYMSLYREAHHIYVVKVTSAAPLAPAEENRLKDMIARHLNGGTMEYSASVDPSLIGGFAVSVGNERLDASISNELKQLRLKLLSK